MKNRRSDIPCVVITPVMPSFQRKADDLHLTHWWACRPTGGLNVNNVDQPSAITHAGSLLATTTTNFLFSGRTISR